MTYQFDLTTSLIHFSFKGLGERTFEPGSERVKRLSKAFKRFPNAFERVLVFSLFPLLIRKVTYSDRQGHGGRALHGCEPCTYPPLGQVSGFGEGCVRVRVGSKGGVGGDEARRPQPGLIPKVISRTISVDNQNNRSFSLRLSVRRF